MQLYIHLSRKLLILFVVLLASIALSLVLTFVFPIVFNNGDEYYPIFNEYSKLSLTFWLQDLIYGSSTYWFPTIIVYKISTLFFHNVLFNLYFTRVVNFVLIILTFEGMFYVLYQKKYTITLLPFRYMVYFLAFVLGIWPNTLMIEVMASHYDTFSLGVFFLVLFFFGFKKNILFHPYFLTFIGVYTIVMLLSDFLFSMNIILPLILTLTGYVFFSENKNLSFWIRVKRLLLLQHRLYGFVFVWIILTLVSYIMLHVYLTVNYKFAREYNIDSKILIIQWGLLIVSWLNITMLGWVHRNKIKLSRNVFLFSLMIVIAYTINTVLMVFVAHNITIRYVWQIKFLLIVSIFIPWIGIISEKIALIFSKKIISILSGVMTIFFSVFVVTDFYVHGYLYQKLHTLQQIFPYQTGQDIQHIIACLPKQKSIFIGTWYYKYLMINALNKGRVSIMNLNPSAYQTSYYVYSRVPYGPVLGATPHYFIVDKFIHGGVSDVNTETRSLRAYLGVPQKIYHCNQVNIWYYKPRENLHTQVYRMFMTADGAFFKSESYPSSKYVRYSTAYAIDGNNILPFAVPMNRLPSLLQYKDYPKPILTVKQGYMGRILTMNMGMHLFPGVYKVTMTVKGLSQKEIRRLFAFIGLGNFNNQHIRIQYHPQSDTYEMIQYTKINDYHHRLYVEIDQTHLLTHPYKITRFSVKRVFSKSVLSLDISKNNNIYIRNNQRIPLEKLISNKATQGLVYSINYHKIQLGKYTGVFLIKGLTIVQAKKILSAKVAVTPYHPRTWFDKLFGRHIPHSIEQAIQVTYIAPNQVKLTMPFTMKERDALHWQLYTKGGVAFTVEDAYLIKHTKK